MRILRDNNMREKGTSLPLVLPGIKSISSDGKPWDTWGDSRQYFHCLGLGLNGYYLGLAVLVPSLDTCTVNFHYCFRTTAKDNALNVVYSFNSVTAINMAWVSLISHSTHNRSFRGRAIWHDVYWIQYSSILTQTVLYVISHAQKK